MAAVNEVARATPVPVALALKDVEVIICVTPWKEAGMPDDVRGMYVGDFSSGIDDEIVEDPPVGTIYLVASNLTDKDEARNVLLHEIGHALGLDETEVAGLGL